MDSRNQKDFRRKLASLGLFQIFFTKFLLEIDLLNFSFPKVKKNFVLRFCFKPLNFRNELQNFEHKIVIKKEH